ncbi:FkbM family methyltransferase [Pelagibacterales bacterium SAG-MED32]|nr:FkbM family methyltransferase [Pelagibacterales bacterium SAG-MED32]
MGNYLLDLSFGFNREDVANAFNNLGERGKELHLYVSLLLDTVFPIIYISFHLGIYHYSNYKNNFIYSVPLLTGAFDLMENIQCAMIMSIPSIESVSDQQIVLASGTNQVKWLLVFTMITIAIFPILKKGYRKLRKSFLRRYLFYTKKEKFVFRLNDILLNLDIRDSIDREIYFTNRYEEEQIKLLLDNIKKYKISRFVDVGANIGIYALTIAKNFPNIKIDAFEPHKGAFERMEANIHQNGFSQIIQTHNLALSNENKEGYLLAGTRFGTYQSGGASVSSEGEMKISQVRGDDLIKYTDDIIAIKIDVEGFELSVLQGIENLIKNNKVFLQIEIFDEELIETSKFLEAYNFKLIEKGTFTHQDTVKDYFYINF